MKRFTPIDARWLPAVGFFALGLAAPLHAQMNQIVPNDLLPCEKGHGPAVYITVTGIASSTGNIRVQSYRATEGDWLETGHWLTRIEVPAHAGTMSFCLPLPAPGMYGIALRHDRNGNGKTDIFSDGGGMSNNPSINIFNLGKPSYKKTAITVGNGITSILIQMRYL